MLEYGMLTGMGGTLMNGVFGAFDALMRLGSDLLQMAFDNPVVSLAVVFAILGWGLLRLRR